MDVRAILHLPTKRETTVPEETNRVLLALVDSASRDRRGVSITYLSSRLGIEGVRLSEILEVLEEAEYVEVEKHGRVQLIAPTLLGYEKADVWNKEKRDMPWLRRVPALIKVIVGSLFAAMLGLLWWWLGLTPSSSNLQPFGAATPIKLYDMGTEPTPYYGGSWFRLSYAPPPDQAVAIQPGEDEEAFADRLDLLFGDHLPVTFDGWVHFRFDLENVASRFQVNINSVLIEVQSNPIRDLEDLLYSPPAGGGDVWDYKVDLSSQTAAMKGDLSTFKAVLVSEGKPVEYLYLRPGERESIGIDVQLGIPGIYTLTPTINYVFREKSFVRWSESYRVAYPNRYRTWFWWYDDQAPVWISRPVSTGAHSPILTTHDVIVDTQSGRVEMPKMAQPTQNCSTPDKWIAFESSMIAQYSETRLFLMAANGSDFRVLSGQKVYEQRRLEWTNHGKLLVVEPIWDEGLQAYRQDVGLVDPKSGKFSIVITGTLPVLDSLNNDVWHDNTGREVCLRNGTGCFVAQSNDDTNGDGRIDDQDASQVYYYQQGDLVRLGFSSEEQTDLSLSHDETMLAFVQGPFIEYDCAPTDSQDIYIMRTDGSGLKKVTDEFGYYRNPTWSPDGRLLAFAAARLADNKGALKCSDSVYHIFVVDLATGHELQLTSGELSDHEPRWSADGQWVLAGGERLTLSRRDGSCTQDLLVPPVGQISNVLMEP